MNHTKRIFYNTLLLISFLWSMNAQAQDFHDHAWKHRVLVVKGELSAVGTFMKQFHTTDTEELRNRKLVIYSVNERTTTLINYADAKTPEVFPAVELPEKYREMLRVDDSEFEILLIGLDGGLKMRKTVTFKLKELFDKIDSMPMRRSEMRKKNDE